MKRIVYNLLLLFSFAALWSGCSKEDELVFVHERPQFDIQQGKILVEVIVPQNTQASEEIAIVGAFNGGESAATDARYKLQVSAKTRYRWGVYLDPATFVGGKTLADGFYFIAKKGGAEKTGKGADTLHVSSSGVGTRIECKIARWASDFETADPNGWPSVPAGKVMLKLDVPSYTPANAKIELYGFINGWNGNDAKWTAKRLSATQYYLILDPADFASGTTLAQQFKFGLIVDGKDWWYYQSNEDGAATDGAGYSVEDAAAGNGYSVAIANWRCKGEIIWNNPPANKIMLRLTLPAYTPDNATIRLYGFVNGWNGSDSKWKTVQVSKTQHYLLLDPADFAEGTNLTQQFKFGLMIDGKEWWYFQSNEDGSGNDGAGYTVTDASTGSAYDITVLGWRSSAELPQ